MINKIIIENFKSIKKVDITLKEINILIGSNGAGKSNFISFFEFLNNLYNQNLQNYVIQNGGSDNLLYYGSKNSDYIFGQVYFDNKNFYEFKLMPDKTNNLYLNLEANGFNINYQTPLFPQHWNRETTGNNIKESNLKSGRRNRHGYFIDHFNSFKVFHFHDTSSSAKVKQKSRINDNAGLKEDAGNIAAFLYMLQEKHKQSYNLIQDTIKSVAPFFRSFDLKPEALNPEYIQLEWKEVESDQYFNAHNLSDGTLRFICLATLLLQPNLPKTIVIDEPELGLHPYAINKLAGLIKSASKKGSQVIISSQSVNLLENFDIEDIIVVDRNKKDSIFSRLSAPELKDWLEEYSLGELWDKNVIGGRP
jgi:predicted ATPase